MEKDKKDKMKTTLFDWVVFFLPTLLGICNLLWLFFGGIEEERLERVFLYAMLGLVGVVIVAAVIFFIYLAKTGKKAFNKKMDAELTPEETILLGKQTDCSADEDMSEIQNLMTSGTKRDYSALRQYGTSVSIVYLCSLMGCVMLLIFLSDTKAEMIAPWVLIVGAVGILFCAIKYGRQYFMVKDNYWLHIEHDYKKFRTWEKYWAHLLVSDRIDTCFALIMVGYVLQYDLPKHLTAQQNVYFDEINMALFLLSFGVVVWEIICLHRRHQEVLLSQPKVNNKVQNFYQISGALAVFISPVIHIINIKSMTAEMAQMANLIVSLVISAAILLGVIYFRVYASRYVKADKLTW